jgi:hypothetical protein
MRRFSSDTGQHGYVLVMLVLVLVVLLGIAALALDLGRLYVLRTEMQNAVDAAALAAAAELNAQEGALTRAEAAGRGLIQSDSHFAAADDKALLGEGDDIGFEFFTSIAPKTPTTNYADAHYVRVTLDPALDEDGESGRYGIDLFFLPVLNVLNIPTQRFVELTASALAGRHFYMCNYPPMMICDPLEAEGGLKENMDAGQQIVLKKQGGGSTWGIGMFGFLYPVDPETGEFLPGSSELGPYLADESKMGCTPPVVKTSTGNVANLSNAWNTRFDIYDKNPFNYPTAYQDYPPATNITDYGGYYNPSNTNQCAPAGYCESNPTEPMCWRDYVVSRMMLPRMLAMDSGKEMDIGRLSTVLHCLSGSLERHAMIFMSTRLIITLASRSLYLLTRVLLQPSVVSCLSRSSAVKPWV